MSALRNFISEIKKFSKANYWVYVVYVSLLILIYFKRNESLLEVYVVTSFHFIGDIFIMMMIQYYIQRQFIAGTYCQIASLVIFFVLKFHTGIAGHGWQYLLSDPLYLLAALKNYYKDVKDQNIAIVNTKSMTALSIMLIIISLAISKKIIGDNQPALFAVFVQTTGIFFFAVALSITGNANLRFRISVVALTGMVIGSAAKTFFDWQTQKNNGQAVSLDGLAISYTLLPLTVLIFYIKRWFA